MILPYAGTAGGPFKRSLPDADGVMTASGQTCELVVLHVTFFGFMLVHALFDLLVGSIMFAWNLSLSL